MAIKRAGKHRSTFTVRYTQIFLPSSATEMTVAAPDPSNGSDPVVKYSPEQNGIPKRVGPFIRDDIIWKGGSDLKDGKYPGFKPNQTEMVDGMEITRDVAVTLRDGIKVYVDIFRNENWSGKLPIILTWSPYGKHGPKTFDIFPNSGVPKGSVSRHAAWEGPDPVWWTKQGYSVINGDGRGSWGSEGDCEILSQQEAVDGYDVIEWAAALPWSNGCVGLSGVSYLAITQWRIAELNPPHLCCINPWEGFSDLYREYGHHGGIPETNFVKFMEWSCRCTLGKVEDWLLMHWNHPLLDDYQRSKSCKDFSKIKVPAYCVVRVTMELRETLLKAVD